MAISGLVLTLSAHEAHAAGALSALEGDPRFTLGCRAGDRLAATLETHNLHEDRDVWDYLNQLPGIVFVDVVFVDFAEQEKAHGHSSQPA